jgi:hypothetical protein
MTDDKLDCLDSHFFFMMEEFGSFSPLDLNSFDSSAEEKWISDEESDACMLCGEPFNRVVRRRHHCRYCGLLFCGACTDNRSHVSDSVSRICEACAVFQLPSISGATLKGLRKWAVDHSQSFAFDQSAKSAALLFFCSLFGHKCLDCHCNATRILCKLYRAHAPSIIQGDVPTALLQHGSRCTCASASLCMSLFVSLYYVDPVGCRVNLTDFDHVPLLQSSQPKEMRRAVARLVYLIAKQKLIAVPDLADFCIADADDQWVLTFLLATVALNFPIPKPIGTIIGEAFSKHYSGAEKLIPLLMSQFERGGMAAARYYGSIILERMSHCEPEIDLIAQRDCDGIVHCLTVHCPQSETDQRPETAVAVHLSSVLLRIWRRWRVTSEPNHMILFSQVLIPLFDVVAIPNSGQKGSNLTALQLMFIEILGVIATFDDLAMSVRSEQMLEILRGFAKGERALAAAARESLDVLEKTGIVADS